MVDLDNYSYYILRENQDLNVVYGIILLHQKHSANEFQQEIYRLKKELTENGELSDGNDIEIIFSHMTDKFDFHHLCCSFEDYIEI